jgi:hypothetical protein
MRAAELLALGWVVAMAGGCSGHLEFDPSLTGTAARGGQVSNQTGGAPGSSVGTGGRSSGTGTTTGGSTWTDAGSGSGSGGSSSGGSGAGGSGTGGSGSGGSGAGGSIADAGPAAGQDGGAPPTAAVCPTGFNVLDAVFTQKCGGCHGVTSPTKNLDLVSAGLAARLVNKPSTCNNRPFLSGTLSGSSAAGHLFDKLAGPVAGCGVQMPAGSTPLSATEIACVNDWAVQAVTNITGGGYAP